METSKRDNWSETTFLASVAKDLMVRFGKDMTKVAVVFPNKRARLFMNEEFLALTDTPMWAPQYANHRGTVRPHNGRQRDGTHTCRVHPI